MIPSESPAPVAVAQLLDVRPMHLQEAEHELRGRLYHWAIAAISREVAEDFPALRACQHNRRVKCFLAWMRDMAPENQLPTCLSLVRRSHDLHLDRAERSADAEAVFMDYQAACSHYHETLPPVSDCDQHAPGFIKADPQLCMENIVREISPICGKSRKQQKHKRVFRQNFGDWTFSTYVQIWLTDEEVDGHSFLQRSDAEPHHWGGEWSSRIDPLVLLGISSSNFPFIGQPHEALCAQSLRASVQMFVPFIPKFIEGLEVAQ